MHRKLQLKKKLKKSTNNKKVAAEDIATQGAYTELFSLNRKTEATISIDIVSNDGQNTKAKKG